MKQLKLLLIVLVSLTGTSVSFGQTKKELQIKVQELSITVVRHEAQIQIMEKSISDLTNKLARLEAQLEIIQLQNNRIENHIYQPNQTQTSIATQPPQTRLSAPQPPQTRPSAPPTIRSQCRGITKAGNRCKRSGGSSGYCYQHGPN